MSIDIDEKTQKAINPEKIGKDMPVRAAGAIIAVIVFVCILKLAEGFL